MIYQPGRYGQGVSQWSGLSRSCLALKPSFSSLHRSLFAKQHAHPEATQVTDAWLLVPDLPTGLRAQTLNDGCCPPPGGNVFKRSLQGSGVVRKQQGICYTSWLQMTKRAKIKNKIYWFLYISYRAGEGGIQLGCALDLEYLRLKGSSTFFCLSWSLHLILSGDMTGLRETHIPNTQPPQENIALVNSVTKKNTVKIWKRLRMTLLEPWTNGFIF